MPVDPAQDPFGAAMVGAGALFALSIVVVLIQRVRQGSLRSGGWLMAVSLLGFLGAAVAGTLDRIAQADAAPSVAPAHAGPAPEAESGEPEPPAGAETPDVASGTDGDGHAGSTGPTDDVPAEGEGAPAAAGGGALERLEAAARDKPWPDAVELYRELKASGEVTEEIATRYAELGDARTTEIRSILGAAKEVSVGKCNETAPVAEAVRAVRSIDSRERLSKLVPSTLGRLEKCRRTLARVLHRRAREARTTARAEAGAAVAKRLSDDSGTVGARTSGDEGEKLRLFGPGLKPERIASLVAGGLLDELAGSGFVRVTFSDGSVADQREIIPKPQGDAAVAELAANGLDQPLKP